MTARSPADPTAPTIHCIGDSHTCFFSGVDALQPLWPEPAPDLLPWFKTHHIGPALAYNLSRTGTRSGGRERLFEVLDHTVPAGAPVLLSFGEIDCRAHLPKQAALRGTTLASVVDDCLDAYFTVVAEVAARGHPVIVYNAVPSRARNRTKRRSEGDDYAAFGSARQRREAIHRFNAGAKSRCNGNTVRFLETHPRLCDRRGRGLAWYFLDSIHLSQHAMPATLHALADLFPEWRIDAPPAAAPTTTRRLADWLAKRTLRLRKELAKATRPRTKNPAAHP